MKKFATIISLILLLGLTSVSITAQNDRLQIVATHSILADVVMNVVGDVADVTSTMPVNTDPHSFEPVASDIIALADADVVFTNGAFFEEGLLEAIENAGTDMNIVTVSSCVDIIAFGGHEDEDDHSHDEDHDHEQEITEMSSIAELCNQHRAEIDTMNEEHDDHNHESSEGHGHSETLGTLNMIDCGEGHADEDSDEDEHEHGACDPHVWMEPHNVMYWTMLIRDTLIGIDPANADTYAANATVYLEELDALVHDFIVPMIETVPEESRVLVTNHDSLGYFAGKYDFEIVTTIIPGGSTLAEPSAGDIASIIDLIREENVTAIFAETTVSDSITQTIAEETNAQLYILYSGSLSDINGPASTYLDYMRYNVTTIVEALST